MHALLGYLICLLVLTPALSVDVFFALIGATNRLHDLLAMVRALSRMLQSVTSPFKIALTLAVLIGVFASDFSRTTRGSLLLVAGATGLVGMLQSAMIHPVIGLEPLASLVAWAAAALAALVCGARMMTTSAGSTVKAV
jgi:hypothetical protein